jgi:hypothetical protein
MFSTIRCLSEDRNRVKCLVKRDKERKNLKNLLYGIMVSGHKIRRGGKGGGGGGVGGEGRGKIPVTAATHPTALRWGRIRNGGWK